MNFNKNKLINKTLNNFYKTYSVMLDTNDFVSAKTNQKIYRYIDKNLKNAFRVIDKEDKKYQKLNKKIIMQHYKVLKYKNKQQILSLKNNLKNLKKDDKLKKKQRRLQKRAQRISKLTLFKKCQNYFCYLRFKRKHLLLPYLKRSENVKEQAESEADK